MIKIAICDDNIEMAHNLENTIHQMSFNNIETDVFTSGIELLKYYKTDGSYNIVLLDIEMPSVNGIETALNLREADQDIVLIFITAYKEYVYQIFEALPFRFLEKPVSSEKLFETLKDAVSYVEEMKKFFSFKKGTTTFQIPAKDILYFEASNRKIKIHANKKEDIFLRKIPKIDGKIK